MTENNKTDLRPQSPISWYPGHMSKTKREIKELISIIDIVYELVDARIPFSSKINDLNNLTKNKEKILIMTKKDLCDLNITNKWIKYYEENGYNVILANLTNNEDYKKIINLTNKLSKRINDKRKLKGLKEKELKAFVLGVPNTGKSTLINVLAGKKVASVANKPGVTKNLSWLKTKHNILILDTPGVLWPKFTTSEGFALAATSAIKTEVLPINEVAVYILTKLNIYYPEKLKERYGIPYFDEENIEDAYKNISKHLNIALKKEEIDYEKVSHYIINDIKNGNIKEITFDRGIEIEQI